MFPDVLNHFVLVYLDDILIFSPDLESHKIHVRRVLQSLLQHQLYVKAEKCEFHSAVSFLGFIIAKGAASMDLEKVQAVKNWPTPTSRKQVQKCLGFANFYRKLIKNFSLVAAPLHALTSQKIQFHWTSHAEGAFQLLKERFTTALVLTLPNPKLQFVVEVDASDIGIEAVLSHRSMEDGRLHSCAFFSKKLRTELWY